MALSDERIPQIKQVQPGRKGNRKLLFLLFVFFLVLLAVVFFRSPFSKVQEIRVYGNTLYDTEEVVAASGLTKGMQFLNVWESKVQKNLKVLRGIREVSLSRHFPGVIQLDVKEYKRVAFYITPQNELVPLLENGLLLHEAKRAELVVDQPIIRHWSAEDKLPALANALAQLPSAVVGQISEISHTPTPYDDQRVTLYMRDGNEVRSVIHQLAKKLVWYPSIASEIPEGEKGVIHLLESAWFSKYGEPGDGEALVAPEDGEGGGEE